jgi:hypothetical protein
MGYTFTFERALPLIVNAVFWGYSSLFHVIVLFQSSIIFVLTINKCNANIQNIKRRIILSEYKWNYLPTCKKDVISVLDKASKEVVNEMRNSPKHTLLYYNALSSLLDKVIVEIASRKIFNAPDDWYYSFEVSNRNARLYLKHIHDLIPAEKTDATDNEKYTVEFDECFSIINYPVESFSVEEYAKVTKNEPVTVRQWIRRGKLRNAFRIGGEWRIPKISDHPSRGYSPVTYYVNCEYVPLPLDTLSSGIGIHNLTITPQNAGMFNIVADGRCLAIPPRLFTDQERIEIEQALLSNPNISNSDSLVGVWPNVTEVSRIPVVTRTGGMRLPEGWNKNLF